MRAAHQRLQAVTLATLCVAITSVSAAPPEAEPDRLMERQLVEEDVKEAAKRPYANDLGPDQIDVSAYPRQMQQSYGLFAQKCSRCHTLARPINSQWASPPFWEQYVKRMWHKPGTGINGVEARQIWEFLSYDSQVRKLDRREAFEALRKQLLEEFKQKYPERYQELYDELEDDAAKLW
ncbi:MAG: hypothetical protein HY737_05685 [Candidatus Omnitrophica bacterium]|nr:hypothetical protein [Candidatus Omnitrophota bacterium]